MPDYRLHHGDCLEVLKAFPDGCVHSVVTDPPYGLSFMGKKWDYAVPSVDIWRECLRVLKPGGHLLSFGGTRRYHRMVVNIEDAGFEIRDQIQWIYGSGFPKSLNVGNGFGTALKPANEPICLARKPLIGTVAENVRTHGTGAMNIDGCRVEADWENDPSKRGFGYGVMKQGERQQYADRANGEWGMKDAVQWEPKRGRFPANVIHDGSDEVVGLFPQTTSGKVKTDKPAYGDNSVFLNGVSNQNNQHGDSGSAARFFYSPKASKKDRDEGLDGFETKQGGADYRPNDDGSNGIQSRLHGATNKGRNHHPTVKPTDLMRYLCRLVTPPAGTVLDPFAGSGSTGKAAVLEGFNFVGVEKEAEYIAIAEARIRHAGRVQPLFAKEAAS